MSDHSTSVSVHLTGDVNAWTGDYDGEHDGCFLSIDGVGAIHFTSPQQAVAIRLALLNVERKLYEQARDAVTA